MNNDARDDHNSLIASYTFSIAVDLVHVVQ